jgi:hypothetical protein
MKHGRPTPPVRTGPGGDFTRDHWPRPSIRIPRALAVVVGLALGAGVVIAIEYLNGRL